MIILRQQRAAIGTSPRVFNTGAARDLLGEIVGRTYAVSAGHVSLSQIIVEILRRTGPAHVTISSWSATEDEMAIAGRALRNARMLSLKLITEPKFAERARPRLEFHFPGALLVPAKTHAKFVTIRNDAWNLAITTTMNLAQQPRLEALMIRDSAELCEMLTPSAPAENLSLPREFDSPVSMGRLTPPAGMASVGAQFSLI